MNVYIRYVLNELLHIKLFEIQHQKTAHLQYAKRMSDFGKDS